MASFKILLVVTLVAFIGSSDALQCKVGEGPGVQAVDTDCVSPNDQSCKIEATITIASKKGTVKSFVQSCDAKDLAEKTKTFVISQKLHDLADGEEKLPYYCKDELCNIKKAVEDAIKDKAAMAAMLSDPNNEGHKVSGAAQTSVAVATIAFSMVMARLAL